MKKEKRRKEEIAEDYCFICKDGGHMRVCDYKNCLKAYHPHCLGKDQTFLETDEHWTCDWHACSICHKGSYFHCFCCPYSVCRGCIRAADFVQVKKITKGFCNYCFKLAKLIEKNIDVDSDGEKVDFKDTATHEFLFKDYWDIVKNQEKLTLIDLHAADDLLKTGENYKSGSDADKLSEEETYDVGDIYDNSKGLKRKRGGSKTPLEGCGAKKKTFIGWGSDELIGFLASIGKFTEEPLSQLEISEIIQEYVQKNNLFHPDKKKGKIVVCDERLHSIFRKKKLKLYQAYSLLERHLAANADSDGDIFFGLENCDNSIVSKQQKRINFDSKSKLEQKVPEPPKSIYAALVEKNIKSLYLKKSLILKLLRDPETFEEKVTGCFVRIKNDPRDFYYLPRKLYQLGQVLGIKKATQPYKIGETSTDIVLSVANMWKDIQISMLSDDNFGEEECEDLRQLVKKGLLIRPTIAMLEKKIRSVHEDIMDHWIDREIKKLQMLIDRANEKGWRAELFEYIDERELLRKPSERLRLLKEVPTVIADTEEEIDATTQIDVHGGNLAVVKDPVQKDVGVRVAEAQPEEAEGGQQDDGVDDRVERVEGGSPVGVKALSQENEGGSPVGVQALRQENEGNGANLATEEPEGNGANLATEEPEGNGANLVTEEPEGAAGNGANLATEEPEGNGANLATEEPEGIGSSADLLGKLDSEDKVNLRRAEIQIIDLDSDDENPGGPLGLNGPSPGKNFVAAVEPVIPELQKAWHYIDPSGETQGPFSLAALNIWREGGFFLPDFKVWRTGTSTNDAILLTDALRLPSS